MRLLVHLILLLATPCLADPRRVIILGDSTQAGTMIRRATSVPSAVVQRRANLVVHNFSAPGARLCNVVAGDIILPWGLVEQNPAIDFLWGWFGKAGIAGILVTIGHNDWANASDPTQFAADYQALLLGMPEDAPVVCISPLWSERDGVPNVRGLVLQDYRDLIAGVCTALGRPYVDGRTLMPNSAHYFADGVHPNDVGGRWLGRALVRVLRLLGWAEAA